MAPEGQPPKLNAPHKSPFRLSITKSRVLAARARDASINAPSLAGAGVFAAYRL
jgi:hypothetical protein